MRFILTILLFLSSFALFSQVKKDSTQPNQLEEVKLESSRYNKSKRNNSQQLQSIGLKEIEFQNGQTTADVLSNGGKIAIQKSQQGGGSPILRGFESSRILLLVDGVRMNNLIFRSGHLQNIITVDENMIESIDALFGPSSTAFGSDALGGAINIQTKKPKLFSEKNNKKFGIHFNSRYSFINKEKSNHIDLNYSGNKWASLTSFSINDFDDLKMGSKRNGKNAFFGSRPFYVETINNTDLVVRNTNPLLQKFSGYTQYNAMQKVLFQPNNATQHLLNVQYSTSSDIPRYDRLTDITNTGNLKSAVWNYGPQKRILAGYKLTKESIFKNQNLSFGANYQNFEESRITRDFGKNSQTSRIEKVAVYSMNADFKTKIGKGELLYGMETFYDDLKSSANRLDIQTGIKSSASTRYPDGENYTLRNDFFATYFAYLSPKTNYNLGFRAGLIHLKSTINDNSFFNFPVQKINQKNFTYSGAAGIVNNPTKNIKIAFNLATGFRVPNIDDLSKIFDSEPGTLIVPNPNIKPEKTITGDINFTLFNSKGFEFENTLYYTRLYDAIITDDFTFNGLSEINYEGQQSRILANQNLGRATIFGYSTAVKINMTKKFSFYGTFNFTYGRVETKNNEMPLDHIPPIYGKTGFNFENKWLNLDLFMLYNGKKHLEDYADNGEDNLQYAPKNGMPAWQTYNFKTAVSALKELTIYSGVENILNIQYRTFASGINAPGKIFYLGLKYKI